MGRLKNLEEDLISKNVRLLIVDSVASLVRKEFGSLQDGMMRRTDFLTAEAGLLKHIAETFSIPVRCFLNHFLLFVSIFQWVVVIMGYSSVIWYPKGGTNLMKIIINGWAIHGDLCCIWCMELIESQTKNIQSLTSAYPEQSWTLHQALKIVFRVFSHLYLEVTKEIFYVCKVWLWPAAYGEEVTGILLLYYIKGKKFDIYIYVCILSKPKF